MNSKSFSESFSKTFSKGVRTAMHLKWPSYLLLLEKQCIFSPKTGHESPDSDPRLQTETLLRQGFPPVGCRYCAERRRNPLVVTLEQRVTIPIRDQHHPSHT